MQISFLMVLAVSKKCSTMLKYLLYLFRIFDNFEEFERLLLRCMHWNNFGLMVILKIHLLMPLSTVPSMHDPTCIHFYSLQISIHLGAPLPVCLQLNTMNHDHWCFMYYVFQLLMLSIIFYKWKWESVTPLTSHCAIFGSRWPPPPFIYTHPKFVFKVTIKYVWRFCNYAIQTI